MKSLLNKILLARSVFISLRTIEDAERRSVVGCFYKQIRESLPCPEAKIIIIVKRTRLIMTINIDLFSCSYLLNQCFWGFVE